jgi:hypothetical protein
MQRAGFYLEYKDKIILYSKYLLSGIILSPTKNLGSPAEVFLWEKTKIIIDFGTIKC